MEKDREAERETSGDGERETGTERDLGRWRKRD